ncbi:MAG: cyclic nucleotide-gated ion channel [Alphaproteobacteria bacterium]
MPQQAQPTLRRHLFEILEIGAIDDRRALWFNRIMVTLILLNVVAVICETVDPLYRRYESWFWTFEVLTVIVFSIEYAVRVWVSVDNIHYPRNRPIRARLRYMVSPYALIDLAAILPFFLSLYVDLRVLRVFRLLRLLKLIRYSPALNTLANVIYSERRALLGAGVIMLGLIVFSAAIIFYIERGHNETAFSSIPQSMWWSLATLTTVGYGDMIPMTAAGKVFGGVLMIFGLAMYALPVGIIASGFASEIHRRDFVVSQDMLRRVPLFEDLDMAALTRIASLLRARIFKPGDVLARQGDHADNMFFILSGTLDATLEGTNRQLGPGEFFGEIALLSDSRWYLTVTASTRSQVMMLEAADLYHLISDHPSIGEQLMQHADDRLDEAVAELGLLDADAAAQARAAIQRAISRVP